MQVYETAAFNLMSAKAQVLWCHLAAAADAKGIIENAHDIRMSLGIGGDAVRELLAAGFVQTTADGHVKMVWDDCKVPHFMRINGDLYVYATDVTAMPHGLFHPGWVAV